MIGIEILNYIIRSLIGMGGMGSVYLAEHKFIKGQMAAIKVINANMLNDFTRKKLLDEATNQSKLGHQNIAHFQNFHIDQAGNAYLIMEYVDGLSLEDYINTVSGLIVEKRVYPIFGPILDAIGYAHKHNILHCDIKPANIVITKEGIPKVLDFGIAKIIKEDGMTEDDGMISGTPSYMSPEQVDGKQMDARSDIYSLGVLLHQMLTGNAPYDTTTLTEREINEKVVNEPLPRMRTYYKYISDKVQEVVDKATAKNPKDRYQSCEKFKEALHKAIYPEPIPRWAWISAAAFFAIAIGIGTYVWDYNRTKIYYYKDYIEQWGVPQGIGELNENEAKHREATYRFEVSKRKLRRMSFVNSYGNITDHHDSEHTERPSDMQLFYNDNGNISYVKILDKSGKTLYKKSYNDKLNTVIFQYDDENSTEFVLASKTLELFKSPFANADNKGKITRYLLTYDENGYITKQEYASFFNTKVGDANGIYARVYERDHKGRIIEERYLGHDGNPKGIQKGLGIRRHKYNENDDWYETSYYTFDGQVSTDGNGVPVVKIEVDKYGNRIKESYTDENGTPVLRTDCSAAGITYVRNEHGLCTEMAFFDVEGKLCYGNGGVAGYTQEFDENGYTSKLTYFDDNRQICAINTGQAYHTQVNDSVGNPIEVWFYDENGNLKENSNGMAGIKMKYDQYGNQIEYISYGTNRKPCVQSDNTVGYSADVNEQGLIIRLTKLDESLNPCKDNNGITTWTREYDRRGNITKISYFDDKNNPVLSNENIAGVNYTYDDNGNETGRTFFNIKGEPCLVSNTFYKAVFTYDEFGNLTSERYYDLNNNLTLNSDGVAGYDYVRDERGNMLENTPIGTNGKLKKDKLIAKRKFDKFNNEIEFAVFDVKGPALNKNYHRYTCKYNVRNQITEIAYYGKNGELVCFNDDKYAIQQNEFDSKGNRTRCTFLGTNHEPIICKEGWHTSTYEYDSQGHITRQLFYGLDNKPTDPKVMVPEGVCKYDKWGNMIYIASLDGKGNFIINPFTGWSIRRTEYNLRGKVLKEAYYSEKDKPIINKQQGYHKAMYEYDDKGNEIIITFWDANEKAMKVEGYHKRTREYDKNGNNIMEAYWDTDNTPISVNGTHKITALYNERSQQTEMRYYGTKGQAVETSDGYHRFVVTYEADGVTYKTMKFYRLNGSLLLSLRWNGSEWITQENNMVGPSSINSSSTGNWKSMLIELNKELPTDLGEDSGYLTIVSAKITSSTSFEIQMKIPYSKYEISEEQMKTYKEYIDLMLQGVMNELKTPSSVKGTIVLSDSKNRVIYKTTK